ncbi:MAG: SDR family oxidoreductase [Kiritimatiellae bacterium]|nr:SDR family oxidoreductase [Kiritimatiellia bacterium]MDD4736349.1 SDR family oxidoreductase [Kiritimatiellia bacterium]
MNTISSSPATQDVLLTGASSEIGLRVLDVLRARQDVRRLFIMARKPPKRAPCAVSVLQGDMANADSLQAVASTLREAEFNGLVIHLAANSNFLEEDGCYAVNYEGALTWMNLLRSVPGLRRFLYVGTAMNCGIRPNALVRMDDPLPLHRADHLTAYTHSKALAEDAITRTAWPYEVRIAKPSIMLGCVADQPSRRDNILWAVKAIFTIGVIPVSPAVGLDCTTYDFGAKALVALAFKPALRHEKVYVSSGLPFDTSFSQFMRELADELAPTGISANLRFLDIPEFGQDWAEGEPGLTRSQRRLANALFQHYRFLAMNVRFDQEPLLEELEIGSADVPAYFAAIPTIARHWGAPRISTRSISVHV